jgi:hypothetical protein
MLLMALSPLVARDSPEIVRMPGVLVADRVSVNDALLAFSTLYIRRSHAADYTLNASYR